MASTYSTNLKIELMSTGENSGTWGTVTNTNLGTALEQAVVGYGNPNYSSDANLTITLTDSNAAQAARALVLNVTSGVSLTATRELVVPTIQKQYIVQNNTTGSQSITVKTSAGTGVTIPNGKKMHVYVDGTNVVQMDDFALIFNVDNLTLDGNTLSSTDTNGNVVIAPNGTGDVQLDADTVRVGDSAAAVTLTSNGAGALTVTTGGAADLVLNTNSGTNSGSITIGNGTNGNITVATNGTGDFYVDADTLRLGDSNANATLTTNGTGDLILNTNAGTNSGSITIEDAANGNILIATNGTGQVQVTGDLDITTIEVTNIKAKDGTASIVLTDATGAVDMSKAVTMSATTQNIALGTSQTSGTFTVGGAAQTGTQTFDQSTKTHTLNIGAGATENTLTKTINIGTGGVSGSTTAINIGSTNGTTVTVNGTVNATTVNVTTLDLTNLEVTNIKAKDGTAAMSIADSTGVVSITANPVLSGGTANGVLYLNGSKVATSGSALTFDGTKFTQTASTTGILAEFKNSASNSQNGNIVAANDAGTALRVQVFGSAAGTAGMLSAGSPAIYTSATELNLLADNAAGVIKFATGGFAEKMRLDASGNLGIGATSPQGPLEVAATGATVNQYLTGGTGNNAVTGIFRIGSGAGRGASIQGYRGVSSNIHSLDFYTYNSGDVFGMRLDSTGLGIGTNSPTTKLDVLGSGDTDVRIRAGSDAALIFSETAANKNWRLKPSSGDFIFQYSATAYNSGYSALAVLTSTGNLGLGVTPSAWGSPFVAFQVSTRGAVLSGRTDAQQVNLSTNWFFASGVNSYIANGYASRYAQESGAHFWYTAGNNTSGAGAALTFTQAMTLDASGNLTVKGIGSNNGNLIFDDPGTAYVSAQGFSTSVLYVNGRQDIRFTTGGNPTGGTERARITSGGYFKASNDGTYVGSTGAYHEFRQTAQSSTGLVVNANNATFNNNVLVISASRNTTNNSFYAITYDNDGAGASRFRVADSGAIATAGGIALGTATPATSGIGVQFPATQSASSNANTLDDYEEGDWTPAIIGTTTAGAGTYTTQTGRYTKVGRLVTVTCYLQWTAHTGTGNMRVDGLPFTAANLDQAASIGIADGISLTAGNLPYAYTIGNDTKISLLQLPTGGTNAAGIPMDTVAGPLVITATYYV